MVRGVLVLVLEHVGQQHDRASIGAVELERGRVAGPALLREVVEHPDQRREHEEHHDRLLQRHQRGDEGDRRQHQLHARGAGEALRELGQRHVPCEQAVVRERVREVGTELSAEGEQVDRHLGQRRIAGSEGGEDQHGRDVAPGVRRRAEPAVARPASAREVRDQRETAADRDQDGHQVEWAQQHQRHDHELLGHDVAAAELEAHARGDRVPDHQADDQPDAGVPLRGHEQGDGQGGHDVSRSERTQNPALAGVHGTCAALSRLAH
jgi:hypothetical protein